MEAYLPLVDVLKTELVKRCNKNPKYSLRAFASSLGLTSSFLSKLLNGKRPLTAKTTAKIINRLALSPQQAQFYQKSFARKKTNSDILPLAYRQINLDQFQYIADWYHFAILELITVEGFDSSPQWIAKKLGINIHQAKDALERLLRLKYLKKTKTGRLVADAENHTIAGPEIVVPAATKQQTQILEKAIQALQEVPIEKRSQTALTVAIPRARLSEAREIITEFRRKMASVLQRKGARDAVYQLSIAFYPLTINEQERKYI